MRQKIGLHARGAACMHDAFGKPHRSKLCVVVISFWTQLLTTYIHMYISVPEPEAARTHPPPIGGLPTARTRNSETVSIALPVYRASPTLPFHPSQRRALRKHTCQLISPHLPGPSLDYTYYYALFNPVPPLLCFVSTAQPVLPACPPFLRRDRRTP